MVDDDASRPRIKESGTSSSGTDVEKALGRARQVLKEEAGAVKRLSRAIDGSFRRALKEIMKSNGRMQLTGVGKSGLVARKIAATLSSTGTSAYFVHAGEALHGDLGMVSENDILLAVSNSGETQEILRMIPALKRLGVRLYAMTSSPDSSLAQQADLVFDLGIEEEACPMGLAPTTSTTACLALGDALAMALASLKGITPRDFALYHPGGSLGRKLLTTVADVLEIREQNPRLSREATVQEALFKMTDSRMGSTSIVNENEELVGIVTDGDIRRAVSSAGDRDLLGASVDTIMTKDPKAVNPDVLAAEALKMMEDWEINHLPVVDDKKKPQGMVNFQDLLRARVW